MDINIDSQQFSRIEVVETGRRRRWSEAEKLRILQESFATPRAVSATARKHGMPKSQLFGWRRAFKLAQGLLPAVRGEVGVAAGHVGELEKIEITLPGGTRLIVGQDIDPAALRRIVKALA
jgi:transposase